MDFIIYHSKDLDGLTSSVILQNNYRSAKPFGYHYNEPFLEGQDLIGKHLIMADVTLPAKELFELANTLQKFILIDHHVSAYESILEFAKENDIPFVKSNFNGLIEEILFVNLNFTYYYSPIISACEICFSIFPFGNSVTKEKIRLLGQYDTWRNNGKELVNDYKWREQVIPFQMASRTLYGLKALNDFMFQDNINAYIDMGVGIVEYQKSANRHIMSSSSFETNIGGLRILACNGVTPNSQSFEGFYLDEIHDAMMAFNYNGKTKSYNFSIYTTKDDVDLLSLVKKLGGGGHAKACGFSVAEIDFRLMDNVFYFDALNDVRPIVEVPESLTFDENELIQINVPILDIETSATELLGGFQYTAEKIKEAIKEKKVTGKKPTTKKSTNGKSAKPKAKPRAKN